MTQLVLDPPHRTLRLVASNPEHDVDDPGRRHRREAVLGAASRRLYRRTIERSLRHGDRINRDALRIVLATRQDRHGGPVDRFRADDIWRLMMVDVVAWCTARRLDVPPGCAHALLVLLATLDADDGFHAGSDAIEDLEQAVHECTGGWCDPHHPTTAEPRW